MCGNLNVSVVVADPVVSQSLRQALAVKGVSSRVFRTAEEFLDSSSETEVGCVVIDLRLPGLSGLELQGTLRALAPKMRTIILAGQPQVSEAIRAFRQGAKAFFELPIDFAEVATAVHSELAIEAESRAKFDEREQRLQSLTSREREVLDRLVEGKAAKQIARELGISTSTVEKHRSHVLQKTELQSVVELTRMMISGQVEPTIPAPHFVRRPAVSIPHLKAETTD